ncbi:MAG TPA: TlpA disulfide reductase family protein [Symbiobacteriaceae bacterium]|nr:TlpA disulfide reductase family protein [Symbiobacteriaceae bacterium]
MRLSLRRRLLAAGIVLSLALLALAGCGGADKQPGPPEAAPASEAQPGPATSEPRPVKGAPAPEIIAKDVKTGEVIRLSDLKGQVVMVNFWATWCPPCRAEMPDMEQLYRETQGKVRILAVGGDGKESAQQLAAFAEEMGLTFPVVHDFGSAARSYRILGLPTTYFIDQNGIIRERMQGAMDLEIMRELLASTEQAAGSQ